MKKLNVLILLIIIFDFSVFAQKSHSDSIFNDAIILDESITIEITGVKSDFIEYSIKKKLRVKLLSTEGAKKFSTISLPETFDPTYIAHFPEKRKYTILPLRIKYNYFVRTITTGKGEPLHGCGPQ